ncbi:mycothiol system anti-sigma-R factor [Fodinicola acaciae]|uniref:mycothiol system anti-sigma-R factor n=1 Tax=Fodinicola acaciae TaxID=2681555 RepID=UPI0013D58671|nr:mycothiol system anti-sigma-R factor [Fodinicola acaciae]
MDSESSRGRADRLVQKLDDICGGDPSFDGIKPECRSVLEEVYLYLDAETDDASRSRIREHLDDCSPCLREFGIEQEVKALVSRCCGGDRAPESLKVRLKLKLREVVIEADRREYRAE